MHIRRLRLATIVLASVIGTALPHAGTAQEVPYEQDFILTAYYSPLPQQCCYVRGSEVADKILNGQGIRGADGTAVYPGMLAAPPSFAFGTRITLPGLGTMTVHDRGGAIQTLANGAVRLDVWAGHGEEGLARALAFGVQHIRGTVYPSGTTKPAESFSLESLPAPLDRLKPYFVAEDGLLDVQVKVGERGLSVRLLQEYLRDLGYFRQEVTGLFGDVTRESLAAFLRDVGIDGPADALTAESAAHLEAARRTRSGEKAIPFITPESPVGDITRAKRVLRFLGYYRGRTTGGYDDRLKEAIIAFQQDSALVMDASSPGAGHIGPKTRAALGWAWRVAQIRQRAQAMLEKKAVLQHLASKGLLVDSTLEEGWTGKTVETLQHLLASRGFFPVEKVNGVFGPLTKQAVLQFQLASGLVRSAMDAGAGTVGPNTLRLLRAEQVERVYRLVRINGWGVL